MDPSDDLRDLRNAINNDDNGESEEEVEFLSRGTPGIMQDHREFKHKKFTITHPAPIDPNKPGTSKQDLVRQFLLKRTPAPPAGFVQLNGRHHQLPQVSAPLPRVDNTNPFTGLSSSQVQELRDLRHVLNNPFARENI